MSERSGSSVSQRVKQGKAHEAEQVEDGKKARLSKCSSPWCAVNDPNYATPSSQHEAKSTRKGKNSPDSTAALHHHHQRPSSLVQKPPNSSSGGTSPFIIKQNREAPVRSPQNSSIKHRNGHSSSSGIKQKHPNQPIVSRSATIADTLKQKQNNREVSESAHPCTKSTQNDDQNCLPIKEVNCDHLTVSDDNQISLSNEPTSERSFELSAESIPQNVISSEPSPYSSLNEIKEIHCDIESISGSLIFFSSDASLEQKQDNKGIYDESCSKMASDDLEGMKNPSSNGLGMAIREEEEEEEGQEEEENGKEGSGGVKIEERLRRKKGYVKSVKREEEIEEGVTLRKQMIEERKNTEDWMMNCALEQAVHHLGEREKNKVKVLVKAFEAVLPKLNLNQEK